MAPECHGSASKIGRGRFFSGVARRKSEQDKTGGGKSGEDKLNFLLSFYNPSKNFCPSLRRFGTAEIMALLISYISPHKEQYDQPTLGNFPSLPPPKMSSLYSQLKFFKFSEERTCIMSQNVLKRGKMYGLVKSLPACRNHLPVLRPATNPARKPCT